MDFFVSNCTQKNGSKIKDRKHTALVKLKMYILHLFLKKEIYDFIPKKFKIIKFEEHMYIDKIKNDVLHGEFDIIARLKNNKFTKGKPYSPHIA